MEKKGRGRPKAKLSTEEYDLIKYHARGGLSYAAIAAKLGLNAKAFWARKSKEPRIEEAYAIGRADLAESILGDQLRSSKNGSESIQKHLGINYAGQTHNGPNEQKIISAGRQVTIMLAKKLTDDEFEMLAEEAEKAEKSGGED